ncbi:hypothetical protein BCY84_17440 [Trypanosoma cruzi cruzi]|nr:hypothetical protein BCY84_17440 [Trypanosoma cruzi cruzi]
MAAKELLADMRALLEAMEGQEARPIERGEGDASTEENFRTPSPSLEDKIGQLLGALRSNGVDDWAGKPAQEDLGVRFFPQPREGAGNGRVRENTQTTDGDTIDSLMCEYLGAVKQVWRTEDPLEE